MQKCWVKSALTDSETVSLVLALEEIKDAEKR
jgi:hypothetical protein